MNDRVIALVRHRAFAPVLTGVASFGVGIFVGKLLSREKGIVHELPNDIDLHFTRENLEDLKEIADKDGKVELVYSSPPEGETIVADILNSEGESQFSEESDKEMVIIQGRALPIDRLNVAPPQSDPEPETVPRNIFAQNDGDWDYEIELARRSAHSPYVIHHDEFFNQEAEDYEQSTLIWYAGDRIMCDEDQTPMYHWHDVVGDLRFGHGSRGDPKVFYVRNDKIKMEFEINLDEGSYSVEVGGLSPGSEDEVDARGRHLRHSMPPRFRLEE